MSRTQDKPLKKGKKKLRAKITTTKPTKKTESELWTLVNENIREGKYFISHHAKSRQNDRDITDIDVLDILENKANRKRKRVRQKDVYNDNEIDWRYCVEGLDLIGENTIRIIFTFAEESSLLIVTVIRLENVRYIK